MKWAPRGSPLNFYQQLNYRVAKRGDVRGGERERERERESTGSHYGRYARTSTCNFLVGLGVASRRSDGGPRISGPRGGPRVPGEHGRQINQSSRWRAHTHERRESLRGAEARRPLSTFVRGSAAVPHTSTTSQRSKVTARLSRGSGNSSPPRDFPYGSRMEAVALFSGETEPEVNHPAT
jgi:hypothetical protein